MQGMKPVDYEDRRKEAAARANDLAVELHRERVQRYWARRGRPSLARRLSDLALELRKHRERLRRRRLAPLPKLRDFLPRAA